MVLAFKSRNTSQKSWKHITRTFIFQAACDLGARPVSQEKVNYRKEQSGALGEKTYDCAT